MAHGTPILIESGTVRTVTVNGGAFGVPSHAAKLAVHVRPTAVSGTTPSLTVSVEWSHDGTNFVAADAADSIAAITSATTGKVKAFDVKAPHFRLVYTISGTSPSFTLTTHAYAV